MLKILPRWNSPINSAPAQQSPIINDNVMLAPGWLTMYNVFDYELYFAAWWCGFWLYINSVFNFLPDWFTVSLRTQNLLVMDVKMNSQGLKWLRWFGLLIPAKYLKLAMLEVRSRSSGQRHQFDEFKKDVVNSEVCKIAYTCSWTCHYDHKICPWVFIFHSLLQWSIFLWSNDLKKICN